MKPIVLGRDLIAQAQSGENKERNVLLYLHMHIYTFIQQVYQQYCIFLLYFSSMRQVYASNAFISCSIL